MLWGYYLPVVIKHLVDQLETSAGAGSDEARHHKNSSSRYIGQQSFVDCMIGRYVTAMFQAGTLSQLSSLVPSLVFPHGMYMWTICECPVGSVRIICTVYYLVTQSIYLPFSLLFTQAITGSLTMVSLCVVVDHSDVIFLFKERKMWKCLNTFILDRTIIWPSMKNIYALTRSILKICQEFVGEEIDSSRVVCKMIRDDN